MGEECQRKKVAKQQKKVRKQNLLISRGNRELGAHKASVKCPF